MQNSGRGMADGSRTDTGPWRVIHHRQTRMLCQHMDAVLPLGLGMSPPPLKSDLGTSDEIITTTGILCVGARPGIRIQITENYCQMTLISDHQWNCKKNLAYLGRQMDTELPLGLGVTYTVAKR
ncbi:hypothetical protein I79_025751 [Cricetulus griseus]|uniref:Uncharacterized protein n=1 Tax=Cricetulus griseus TaxID=10029 RepID=G3IP48_CRIGR|nr:hypothetical protein I79_025751 [Cricetulus griseus]